MGGETWSLTAKLCDSCKTAPSAVFCRADSAYLCLGCDAEIHAANKLASRHGRVYVCDVCEQAPASVTCRADAAALCAACDRDIHSANPLSRRHERHPAVPFYDAAAARSPRHSSSSAEFSEEEAEAASWLLLPGTNPDHEEPGSPEYKPAEYLFSDMDPYLDLDLIPGSGCEQKPPPPHHIVGDDHPDEQSKRYPSDGVVPVQSKNEYGPGQYPGPVVHGFPTYEMDYPGSKPFMYNFTTQSLSQSVSSSSLDVGVVPDHSAMADVSDSFGKTEAVPVPVSGLDREARVLRYREKRKNRKFEKTIRYASRKAYAETRPRIKGRFAKRSELDVDSLIVADAAAYGIVPSF